MRRRRGFTLLEVVIASITGVVLVALTAQVLTVGAGSRDRLRVVSADAGTLRRAYETMSRDLHGLIQTPEDAGAPFGLTGQGVSAGGDTLQFASSVGDPLLASRASCETMLVYYALEVDPRDERPGIWRYAVPYPFVDTQNPLNDPDVRRTPLIPGVTAVTYLFHNPADQTWSSTWDDTTTLPTAIRVDLAFVGSDPEAAARQESWIFELPGARSVNDAAQAQAEATGETQ